MGLKSIAYLLGSVVILSTALEASGVRCQKENIFDNAGFYACPGPQDPSSAVFCCGNKLASYCCSTPTFGDDEIIGKSLNEVKQEGSNLTEIQDEEEDDEVIPDLSDSVAEKVSIVQGLAKLVGIIIGVAVFVVVVCVVCCCCCPFCWLAKRRTRGQVIRTNADLAAQQQQALQQQQGPGVAYAIPPEQFAQQQQQQFAQQQQQQYVPYPNQAPSPMGYPGQPVAGYPQGGMAYPPAVGAGYPVGGYPPAVPGIVYPTAGANPPPYPGLPEGQPLAYQPTLEKSAYQTQPAYNPNY